MIRKWFIVYIGAWIDFICAVIRIITIDFYYPTWNYKYLKWITYRSMKKEMEKQGIR